MGEHRTRRRRRPGVVVLVPLALLASSAVVYQASNAAFSAQTTNGSNTWQAGSVVLADNDAGNALFTVTGAKPGDTDTKCILVTYTGTLAANVKLYVSTYTPTTTANATNGLGPFLNFTVEQGTGTTGTTGVNGSCSAFTASGPTYLTANNDTLHGFATAKTSWGTGAAAWSPAGANESRAYRVTWTMQDTTGTNAQTQGNLDNAQGSGAAATLTWEARNS